jgi:hypothetical protein
MRPSFDHLKSLISNPAGAAAAQKAYDAKRLADVEKAYRSRPHFLPIYHTLPAAAESMPVEESTEPLNHDVIVWGAITDGEDRNALIYRDTESLPIVRFGNQSGLMLSLDAIAGHSVASGQFHGPLTYPEPYLIPRDQSLALAVYQEANPGVEEQVATVFCAERVYSTAAEEATLPADVRAEVLRWIAARPAPEPRYEVLPVAFDADGFATAETPRASEPMLAIGFRSTFTDATVNFGFDGDSSFSKAKFPIWALCSEPGNNRALFQMLKTPLLIPTRQQLLFSFFNKIDTVAAAGLEATDGNIEVLLRTV